MGGSRSPSPSFLAIPLLVALAASPGCGGPAEEGTLRLPARKGETASPEASPKAKAGKNIRPTSREAVPGK